MTKGVQCALARYVSHSCPSPAKFSVESFMEESRQLLTRSRGKNKRDSGKEGDALNRSLFH